MHENRTCTERNEAQQELGEFLSQIFDAAETFTRDNWPIDLPPIIRFEDNPYLMRTVCEFLRRFYKGVQSVGYQVPPDLARGFFAVHGTSTDSIECIFRSGFDPKCGRRGTYGPGEYFGVTPAISHGYCKIDTPTTGYRTMIINFILRCDRVTTKAGFFHIFNNPLDYSTIFNLPVAVVTYKENIRSNHFSTFPTDTPSTSANALTEAATSAEIDSDD